MSQILSKPVSPPHDSSETHASGTSEFVDDRPELPGELCVGVIYSPFAHAEFKIDSTPCFKVPGVVCVLTAKDVHHNIWGSIIHDQPLIAENTVQYAGEVIAIVAAETPASLRQAIVAAKVSWKSIPAILSIDVAIEKKSFIGSERTIQRGDCEAIFKSSSEVLTGRLVIEGAEHFYLENQSAVAYPKEKGQLEVHSSTQHPTETQHLVAEACGITFSSVTCITKRLGGGFGGKESQAGPIAAYAGLVAQKTGKPARIVLSKDDDMIMTGKRNPFQIDYRVAFAKDGTITALDAHLFSDGGAYADLSTAIMERAMLHVDNAYFIANQKVTGQVCRTHYHPHTAFRGFGGPKGVALIEMIIERIAAHLAIDALDVRHRNVYRPGKDVTHYGQVVENNKLPELFSKLEEMCDYRARRKAISSQNSNGNLRGLSLTAVKFGISFTTRFLNQGNALVILHRDGSIQVSTGGVEMGQGVHTRVAMLVAEAFGVDLRAVRVMATQTDKNANTPPTAASSGTDLNGAAAMAACKRLQQRLGFVWQALQRIPKESWPSRVGGLGTHPEIEYVENDNGVADVVFSSGKVWLKQNPAASIGFAELIREAYHSRISLSEYGFFSTPHLSFDKLKGRGRAFLYYTQGVAASEVEIDHFTGAVKVQRVDILMDLGRPINHALDMGQVTGGFIQGMGWLTTEKLVYSPVGLLVSHSPSTYKIPNIQDTPRQFNVNFLENNENDANIRGTKAVGEPPLMLAISVWTAIQDALRHRGGEPNEPLIRIPATSEEILRAWVPGEFARFES